MEPWTAFNIIMLLITGLGAGLLGGMLGVGGSVIMIPALVVLFGQGTQLPGFHQHLYQAAAMIVNVFVVVPATVRHYQAGAVMLAALKKLIPIAVVAVLIGVAVSNLPLFSVPEDAEPGTRATGPLWLGRGLALFQVYVIALNVKRLFRPRKDLLDLETHLTWPRSLGVGGPMGFVAGLFGIGGGALAVPLQQVVMGLPLRNCIANSSTIIIVSATIGAVMKNATLAQHQAAWQNSLILAAILAPTAMAGGYFGGRLTHVLPTKLVRIAFIILMALAAYKLWGF